VTGWPFYEGGPTYATLGERDGDTSNSEVVAPVGYRGLMALGGNGALLPGWPHIDADTCERDSSS
jgi:hypothetical protein